MSEIARYTYRYGSRPEGVVLYDDGPNGGSLKIHSFHDSDPARGQSNSFDLVRAHRFHHLDKDTPEDTPITERPSYKAMCELARSLPEIAAATLASEFEDLGPAPTPEPVPAGTLARPLEVVLATQSRTRWLVEDEVERGVIAVVAGPRGSFKSFWGIDLGMRVALSGLPVYAISAEGGDFDRRARAWLVHNAPGTPLGGFPMYVVEQRINMSDKEVIERVRQDCLALGIRPALFILDTFSKLSAGLEENDNTAVKTFIGLLDNGLKRAFDATVLLVAHTGHSDKGRTRGASALGADTDAEYIVSRLPGANTVSITRERFKSSPELPPLFYEAQSISLDYQDEKGRPVTSLVLVNSEAPRRVGPSKVPRGANQTMLYDRLKMMAPAGTAVAVAVLLKATIDAMPIDEGENKNVLRTGLQKALKDLAAKGLVHTHGADVSLTPLEVAAVEDFLS